MDGDHAQNHYRYQPDFHLYHHNSFTNTNTIRLLNLLPGRFDDNIFVELLEEVSLSKLPEYEALSYAWDSPIKGSPVYCNGKAIMVTENCVAALRQLRHEDKKRSLWVDALCIDQTSLEERGHQVQHMGEVYSQAKSVVIWLGKSDEMSDFVMKLLIDCGEMENSTWFNVVKKYRMKGVLNQWRAKETNQLESGLDVSDIFGSIYKRSWFTRMWVVQEFALSQDAHFQIGDQVIDASRLFEKFDSILNARLSEGEISLDSPLRSSMMSYFRVYRGLRDALRAGKQDASTAAGLLIGGRLQMATDPKDAVFGTYGILQRLKIPLLPPSYTKTIQEIYTEATKAAIEHDKSLLVLMETFESKAVANLPSWVPDWSVEKKTITSTRDFSATKASHCDFTFLLGHLLSVNGIVIDTIAQCAPGEFPSTDNPKSECSTYIRPERHRAAELLAHEIIPSWIEAASALTSYPTGEDVSQAFGLTMVSESRHMMTEIPVVEGSGFQYWLQSHLMETGNSEPALLKEGKSWSTPSPVFRDELVKKLDALEEKPTYANEAEYASLCIKLNSDAVIYDTYVHIFSTRTVFFTTEGGYMGKGLLGIEKGDKIILVAGTTMPLVARRIGDNYRLFGPCYIHGVMYGERWPRDESEVGEIVFE